VTYRTTSPHAAGQVVGKRYAPAVEHIVEIAISGLGGLALLGRGILVVFRGEPPTVKATGRTWRSLGEASMFWFLLGSAMLLVAFMWIGSATGFAGPDGVAGPDAGFYLSFVPALLCILAVTRYRPRKVAARHSNS
jgi:apolipoprotein N-acyltransferase